MYLLLDDNNKPLIKARNDNIEPYSDYALLDNIRTIAKHILQANIVTPRHKQFKCLRKKATRLHAGNIIPFVSAEFRTKLRAHGTLMRSELLVDYILNHTICVPMRRTTTSRVDIAYSQSSITGSSEVVREALTKYLYSKKNFKALRFKYKDHIDFIRDELVSFYGEENVWYRPYSIRPIEFQVYLGDFEIEAEDRTHPIKSMYIKLLFNINNVNEIQFDQILGLRTKITFDEYSDHYMHSHLPSSKAAFWNNFCLGDSIVAGWQVCPIKSSEDMEDLLMNIEHLVRVEDPDNPYKRIKNIDVRLTDISNESGTGWNLEELYYELGDGIKTKFSTKGDVDQLVVTIDQSYIKDAPIHTDFLAVPIGNRLIRATTYQSRKIAQQTVEKSKKHGDALHRFKSEDKIFGNYKTVSVIDSGDFLPDVEERVLRPGVLKQIEYETSKFLNRKLYEHQQQQKTETTSRPTTTTTNTDTFRFNPSTDIFFT